MKEDMNFSKGKDKPKKELPEIHPNLAEKEFLTDWGNQYGDFDNPIYKKRFYYQAPKTSVNALFSSKGWKAHVQFEKGYEKQFASILNTYGQYFKIEGYIGSYFNSVTESGATIYVGSRQNLEKLIDLIEDKCSLLASSRNYTRTVFGKSVYGGSGTDEPVGRGIGARFDVQKSLYKDKYSEYGFATWLEFRGLPVLAKDIRHVRELEDIIEDKNNNRTQNERNKAYLELKSIFQETEHEILKDFGEDFVYGPRKDR